MIFKYSDTVTELCDSTGKILSLSSHGKEFVAQQMPLFCFRLRKGKEVFVFDSDNASKIQSSNTETTASFVYGGFENYDITFNVNVSFTGRAEFNMSYVNNTGMCVEWVNFPQIAVPNDLVKNGGSGNLIIDKNEGLLIDDMTEKEKTLQSFKDLEYPSRGLFGMFPAVVESQFLAYYDDKCGLYIAAEDKERAIKGIDFEPLGEDAIKMHMRLYPGVEASVKEFDFGFSVVMENFTGAWESAAELYRVWFENNLPEGLVKVKENKTLPEWYTDSPLVVTYPVQGIHDMDTPVPNRLFPYENALTYLDEFSKETNSRILTVLMHWEGTAPWCPPYVWPPLGGAEALQSFAEKLHDRNFLLGVYCSGLGYTLHSNLNDYNMEDTYQKENLEQYMCADAADSRVLSNICQAQRVSNDLCVSQEFSKNVLVEEAAKMASVDLDYIQILDQNHGGTPYFCFSEKHGHAPVPGKWMVEHMTDLLQRLKKTVGDKILLGCESASAESYVPYLMLSDNRFNLNYAGGRPVPIYAYIYHEYLHNFSGNSVNSLNFIDINKSPDCHLMRVAYSFLAGDLMTLVINQDGEIAWSWGQRDFSVLPEREPILKFVKSATSYRRGAGKEYLVYGRMIKACDVDCETVQMAKPRREEYDNQYPVILTSAWCNDKGQKAQFLANYTATARECTVDLTNTKGAEFVDGDGNVLCSFEAKKVCIKVEAQSAAMLLLK